MKSSIAHGCRYVDADVVVQGMANMSLFATYCAQPACIVQASCC
jgi:hypothetical protein